MAANIETFDFDPEKLRQKYKEERDKRIRPDGNDQYKEVKGDFSYFVEDPYVEEKTNRDLFASARPLRPATNLLGQRHGNVP